MPYLPRIEMANPSILYRQDGIQQNTQEFHSFQDYTFGQRPVIIHVPVMHLCKEVVIVRQRRRSMVVRLRLSICFKYR